VQQQLPRMQVARVFEPAWLAGHLQRITHQREARRVTGTHEHLLRRTFHAPVQRQVLRDRHTQRAGTTHIAHGQAVHIDSAHLPGDQPRPQLARKAVERRQAQLQQARGRRRRHGFGFNRQRLDRALRQRLGHHCSRLAPRQEEPFAHQQLVGRLHRAPGHLQFLGQAAHRRHPLTRAQLALVDGLAKAPVDLLVFGQ
jgi:hypothetical protein